MEHTIEEIYKDLQITNINQIKKLVSSQADINYLIKCSVDEIPSVPPYYFISMNTVKLSKLSREKILNLTHDQIKYLKPNCFQMILPSIIEKLLKNFKEDRKTNLIGCYMPNNTIIPINGQSVYQILQKGLNYSSAYYKQAINKDKRYDIQYNIMEREKGLIMKHHLRYRLSLNKFPEELNPALRYNGKIIDENMDLNRLKGLSYEYEYVLKYLKDNYTPGLVGSKNELKFIPRLYSLSEVASSENTSLISIQNLIKKGILPHYRIPAIRISLEDYHLALGVKIFNKN